MTLITFLTGIVILIFWILAVILETCQLFAGEAYSASPFAHMGILPSFHTLLYIIVLVWVLKLLGIGKLFASLFGKLGASCSAGFAALPGIGSKAVELTEDTAIGVLRKVYGNPDCITTASTWDGGKLPETRTYGKTPAAAASAPAKSAAPTPNPATAAPVAPAAASQAGAT
jgi:hypothetical protein